MSPLYLAVVLIISAFIPPSLGQGYGPRPTKGKKHRPAATSTLPPDMLPYQPGYNSISSTPEPDNSLGSYNPPAQDGGSFWWQNPNSPFSGATAPAPQPAQPGGCGGGSAGGCGSAPSSPPVNIQGNPFLSGLQPGGGAQQPAGQTVACSSAGHVCAPKHLCSNGVVNQDGQGLFQVRSEVQYCNAATEVCCQLPASGTPSGGCGSGYGSGPCVPPQPSYPAQPPSGGQNNAGPGLIHVPPSPRPSYPASGPQYPSASIPSPTYSPAGNNFNQPLPNYNNVPRPAATQAPYTGPLNTTPHPGCAAALKCVPESYCTAEGVMSDRPVTLTREQYENRVAMSDCADPDTGVLGKCCRDPNYTDPWPGGMMMMKGGGGKQQLPQSLPQPQPQPQPQPVIQDCGPAASCQHPYQCADHLKVQPTKSCRVPLDGAAGVCCSNDKSAFPSNLPGIPQKPHKKPTPGYPQPKPSAQPFPQNFPSQQPSNQPFPQTVPSQQPYPQRPSTQPFPQTVPSQSPYPQKPSPQPFPQTLPSQSPYPQRPSTQPFPQTVPSQSPYPQKPSPQPFPQTLPSQSPYPQKPSPQPFPQTLPSQSPYPQRPSTQPLPQTVPSQSPYPQKPSPQPFPQTLPSQSPTPQKPSPQPFPQTLPSQSPYPQRPSTQPFPQTVPSQQPSSQPFPQTLPSQQPIPQNQPGVPSSPQPFPQNLPSGQPRPQLNPFPQQVPSQQPFPQQRPQPFPQQIPTAQPSQPIPSTQPPPPGLPHITPDQTRQPFPSSLPSFPAPQPTQSHTQQLPGLPRPGQPAPKPGAECGIRRQVSRQGLSDTDAGFSEFPWQALIVSASSQKPLCSGAIISETAVLTAAHCLQNVESSDVLVQGGVWKLNSNQPKPIQTSHVAAIARHPSFDTSSLFNDLAVLILSQPLKFDEHIDKICLPPKGQDSTRLQGVCTATGWGKPALQGNIPGSILHQIPVSLIPHTTCEEKLRQTHLGRYFKLNPSFQCAVPTGPSQDLCKVDAGGPIACDRGDGHHELSGLYSWDVGCSVPNSPTVFGGIDTDWIESVLARPVDDLVRDELNEVLKQQQQEELGGVDIDNKPGFSQGYGKK